MGMNMKCRLVVLSAILVFFIVQACGNVSADSVPQMPPNQVITGISVTSADNRILGEIGDPSDGGDAEGKRIACENGSGITSDPDNPVSVPVEFRMGTPYPNPSDGYSIIEYSVPCKMDNVSLILVEPDPKRWGPVPGLMNSSVLTQSGEVIWRQEQENVNAGVYSLTLRFSYDSGINGFFRLYLKTEGILAWRDVAIFTGRCTAPPGFPNVGQNCGD